MSHTTYFGDHLRALLAENGLNDNQLAIALGMSRAHIGKLVSGSRRPKTATMQKIAIHLGVPLAELAGYSNRDRLADAHADPSPISPQFLHQMKKNDQEYSDLNADTDAFAKYLDEAGRLVDLYERSEFIRELAQQLQRQIVENAQLRARLAVLASDATASRRSHEEVRLPLYAKVGAGGTWSPKPRRYIALPEHTAARGDIAAEIASNALDRVPITIGDVVVARHDLHPKDGAIVLAKAADGQILCLRYRVFASCALLVPESTDPSHPLIPVGSDMTPFGVVSYVHRPGLVMSEQA